MSNFTLRAASAALLITIGGLAFSAPPPPTPPVAPPGSAPLAPTNLPTFRATQVLGTKILIQNNTAIGTVDDIVFDEAGNLDYLIVATGNNKLITVPWDAAKFDLEKKTGIVRITPDMYKTIPTYTATTYPAFYTSAYRTDIYKTYGLTPRALRRLERRTP